MFCTIRFITRNPIKRALFLISSVVSMVIWSFQFSLMWFNYVIVLLFLRGVFVLLLYLSSFGQKNSLKIYVLFLFLFIRLILCVDFSLLYNFSLVIEMCLDNFFNWFLVFIIILNLLVVCGFILVKPSGPLRNL